MPSTIVAGWRSIISEGEAHAARVRQLEWKHRTLREDDKKWLKRRAVQKRAPGEGMCHMLELNTQWNKKELMKISAY